MKLETVIIILCLFKDSSAENKACPTEYTTFGAKNLEIKWESPQDSVVTSFPACLDENERFLLRKCENGMWYPTEAPLCYNISMPTSCPPYTIHLTDRYCALITVPQEFDHGCPTDFVKYYNLTRLDLNFTFWSPIRKLDDVFVYTSSDGMYGKEFVAPNQKSDCYVNQNGSTLPRYCSEKHHQLCVRNVATSELAYERPEVKLKFDQKRGKLILNVYKPGNVLQKLDAQDEAIYCFTNADEIQVKSPLKVKSVSAKKNLHVYEMAVKYEHPGEYWCELFDSKQNVIRTNNLIAYKKKRGHEYSLRVTLLGICPNLRSNFETTQMTTPAYMSTSPDMTTIHIMDYEDCTIVDGKLVSNFLDQIGFKDNFYNVEMVTRVMKIIGKSNGNVDVILHITTMRSTNIIGEYHKLKGFLGKVPGIRVTWFRSSDYCFPETTNTTILDWKLTALSKQALPKQICLDSKRLPYKRKCLGSFLEGAYWEEFIHTCNLHPAISESTIQLYDISMNREFSSEALIQIQNITSDSMIIIPLDVFLVANTLHNVIEHPSSEIVVAESDVVDNMIQTIENIMVANETMLREAQIELNATDTLLDSIEMLFGEDTPLLKDLIFAKINNAEVFTLVKPNFIVHIAKPFLSNVNGIALYVIGHNETGHHEFTEDSIVSMRLDESFDDLLNVEHLVLATHVPLELLELIAIKNENYTHNITVITTIFNNHKLFNSEVQDLGVPQSRVVSVRIPDFGIYLDEPLPLLFRTNSSDNNSTCAFWQYGEYSPNKTGQWSKLGGHLEVADSFQDNANFTKCYFNHLTHFALLITSRLYIDVPMVTEHENNTDVPPNVDEFNLHQSALSIITFVGCTLSLLGILGIFLTALCFPRWREKTGTIILLQLSLTILLEIVVVQVATVENLIKKTTLCTIVGTCLHYVVLAKFSWMFVSAILQYLRFVKIFQVLPEHLILKAMLFAWGLPLVPVGVVAGVMPGVYNLGDSQKICYPSGLGLYLGLFLPVALIVTCNLIVFILVMKSVFNPDIEVRPRSSSKGATQSKNKLQIYLGILLFFMLGVPWVFGILAEIALVPLQLIFVYLFCLTATLQGCVIFVFYVTLDKDTRMLWVRYFRQRQFKAGKTKLNVRTYF